MKWHEGLSQGLHWSAISTPNYGGSALGDYPGNLPDDGWGAVLPVVADCARSRLISLVL